MNRILYSVFFLFDVKTKQTFGGEIGFALCFVRPIYKKVSKTTETGCYLI